MQKQAVKTLKPKKCKVCRSEYAPRTSLQQVCSPKCALDYAKVLREKKERLQKRIESQERKEAKERIKSRSEHLQEAQKVFNAYIRERDRDLPCISCGTMADVQYAAGHYRPTSTSPEIRFNEDNVHKQCNSYCNRHKHGNLTLYRENLIKKIGIERVEWLESKHEPAKWSIEDLKEIKETYKQKLKEIKK